MQPMTKKILRPVTLKIERFDRGLLAGHAHITTKDGEVNAVVPRTMIDHRFKQGDGSKIAYFKGHFSSTVGALEIDDRVDLPEAKRW